MDAIVELRNVSKKYRIYNRPGDRLKELATLGRCRFHKEYWALWDVSLSIQRGETFCVIGENGSGKSTLLQIIAGILQPTSGEVRVHGRITALLELGAGFNPEFTGRENVHLNGAILGFTADEINRKLDGIFSFAEIGSYVEQPVRTYSSGMVVRLAFAVAVHLDPDILIVDEALAVGDIYFRQRCMRKIHELRARGVSIIYVTHDTSDVKELGHRTLWLEHGSMVELGDSAAIVQKYLSTLLKKDALRAGAAPAVPARPAAPYREPPQIVTTLAPGSRRHGDESAEVLGVAITDESGRPLESVRTPARIVVRVSVRAKERLELPIVGFLIRTGEGVDVTGANTTREDLQMSPLEAGHAATVDFIVDLPELAPAQYTFNPAISDGTLARFRQCDLVECAASLRILPGPAPVFGYVRIPCVAVATPVVPAST